MKTLDVHQQQQMISNTFTSSPNQQHFAEDIFKYIFLKRIDLILLQILTEVVSISMVRHKPCITRHFQENFAVRQPNCHGLPICQVAKFKFIYL